MFVKILNVNLFFLSPKRGDDVVRTYTTYKFFADATRGCNKSELKYQWTLKDNSGHVLSTSQQSGFYLEKYTLTSGKYEVTLNIAEVKNLERTQKTLKVRLLQKLRIFILLYF